MRSAEHKSRGMVIGPNERIPHFSTIGSLEPGDDASTHTTRRRFLLRSHTVSEVIGGLDPESLVGVVVHERLRRKEWVIFPNGNRHGVPEGRIRVPRIKGPPVLCDFRPGDRITFTTARIYGGALPT